MERTVLRILNMT